MTDQISPTRLARFGAAAREPAAHQQKAGGRDPLIRKGPGRRLGDLASAGAIALGLSGCAVSTPFQKAEPQSPPSSDAVIVAITEATLGDDAAQRRAFWANVERVDASLPTRDGFLGVSKRTELFGDRVWTMTVWEDEASLDAFVRSDVHQTAIAEAYGGLDGARFVRFEVTLGAVPVAWSDAIERLTTSGRRY